MTEKHEPSPPDTPEVEPVYEHFRLEYPSGTEMMSFYPGTTT
jgi:hypothetical protein